MLKIREVLPEEINNCFTIMSYNTLCECYSDPSQYKYVSPENLNIDNRISKIFDEIKETNSDILVLQEVDKYKLKEFENLLEGLNYQVTYSNKPTNINLITALKKDKFTLQSYELIDFNQELGKLDKSFTYHIDYNSLIAVLSHRNLKDKKIVIANVHLIWNRSLEYIRFAQSICVLEALSKRYNDCIPIICGDFNSLPSDNIIRHLYKQPLLFSENPNESRNAENMKFCNSLVQLKTKFKSAYEFYNGGNTSDQERNFQEIVNSHPAYSSYNNENYENENKYIDDFLLLDYIFFDCEKLKIVELIKIPEISFIPNAKYPSDHLKIGSKLCFI